MQRKSITLIVTGLFLLIFSMEVYSRQIQLTPVQLRVQDSLKRAMPELKILWNSKLGTPLQIKKIRSEPLRLDPGVIKSYFTDNFKSLYKIQDPDREIKMGPIKTDREGYSHISLYQEYENISVYGVSLKLSLDRERRLNSISGKWIPAINVDTTPRLNRNQVLDRLLSYLREKYTGPTPLPDDLRIEPDKFKLVIFNPGVYTDTLATNYLAYHVVVKFQVFFVDAQTGRILYTYRDIHYTKNRETYNSDDCLDWPGTLIIDESGPVGGVTPDAETQNAHDFAGETYDYYWNTHERDSYDGDGSTIVSTVHSGLPGSRPDQLICCLLGWSACCCEQKNAAWIPSLNQFVYGDGGTLDDGRAIEPLCNALDVVAHEFTHAVTQYSVFDVNGDPVGLDYSGQSGALNESFSDFFSAMVDRDDWTLGEDLFSDGTALRDMADPTVYGLPDHMDNYVAGGDVHENSSIPNKAAYLIGEGGIHPHSNIAVTGIGKEAAEKILYRTLTANIPDQTANFLDAREAAMLSCEELYPGDAAKYASVWNAFVACGICDPDITGHCTPYSPIEDREPVDIAVLLDYSDSMNSEAEPGGRDKIDVLKDAAEIFLRTWEIFAVPGDRVDIVFFDSDVSPLTIDLQPLMGNVETLINEIRTRPTGMYTAMGGALQVALEGLSSVASHPAIILFTNGIQNVNPMAVRVGDHYEIVNSLGAWGGTSSVAEHPGTSLASYGIPIHIIGIGEAAATSYHSLLNDIREETGGLLHLTTSPDTDLRRFYLEDLVETLSLSTLEMIGYGYGTLDPSQSMSETFAMDGAITRAAFVVHWVDKPGIGFPAIKIDSPSEVNLKPTRWVNGQFYRTAIFDFPYILNGQPIDQAGTWRIYTDESSNKTSISYQATLLADETAIHYDFNLPRKRYWTGDPVIVTARVTESGSPLTNLTTVKAILAYPRNPLGTFLSTNPDTGSVLRTDLLSSRGQSKLLKILDNPLLRKSLEPKTAVLELYDDGNPEHGDTLAGDGTYSVKVIDTTLPGLYSFTFDVQGTTSTGWPIQRTQMLSTIVRVKPDKEKSRKTAKWKEKLDDGSATALITVIPYDRFENFLGPDFGDAFRFSTTYGEQVGQIYDALDGSYEYQLHLEDRTQDPIINLRVLGFEVCKDSLSNLYVAERFGISAHLGYSNPSGNFGDIYDPDFTLGADFEFLLSHYLSLEALFGYHTFKSDYFADTYWINLSGNAKYFLSARRLRPFINGGIGAYKTKDNSSFYFGINAGSGIAVQIKPKLYFDSSYNYHSVFTTGDNTQFYTLQFGLKYRF